MRLHKVYLLLVIITIGFKSYSQTIIPGGYVSGTWTEAGSPYDVRGTITIHEDSSLLITNGVEIEFRDGVELIVQGHISAIGEPFPLDDWITFTGWDTWDGIYIDVSQPGVDTCRFTNCHFEMAHNSFDYGGAMQVEGRSEVVISNCIFWMNSATEKGGALFLRNSNIRIEYTEFEFNYVFGDTIARGGAIYMEDSNPVILNSVFYSNETLNGGAVYCVNSSPRFENSKFWDNTSNGGGGAIVFNDSGQPILKNCFIYKNNANGSGGAIAFLEGINCTLEDCRFIDNTSTSDTYLADGGAVMITPYDNEVNFLNCEFSLNYAEDFGGALYITSPSNVIGCLFQGNSMPSLQESKGGAITIGETSVRIVNSTFANNYALYGSSIYSEDAELYMLNNILWDEGSSAEPRIFLSTNVNPPLLFVDHSDLQDGQGNIAGTGAYMVHWGEGNIDVDPHFLSPGTDFSLAWNSPCINTGSTDTLQLLIPAEDIAGNPRIMGGEIDMGCYEYQQPISIAELSVEQEFLVYPNPARDYINIKNTSGADFAGQLYLSDLSGKRAFERTVNIQNYSSFRISVSGLTEGMYILNIASENSFEALKIIIQ